MNDLYEIKTNDEEWIDAEWKTVISVIIGDDVHDSFYKYYMIEKSNEPYLLVKTYEPYRGWAFEEIILWDGYVCVGFSDYFSMINLSNFAVVMIDLRNRYFGHIFTQDDYLWVSSMTDIVCINNKAEMVWRLNNIAVDGITFGGYDGRFLEVSCEMDPPGGWVDYIIDNFTVEIKDNCD